MPTLGLPPCVLSIRSGLMPRPILLAACLLAAALAGPVRCAPAQLFSFSSDRERPVQAVWLGYYLIDFDFDGDAEPLFSFEFDDPAYGLVYSRPNFLVTFAYGEQRAGADREGLRLVDLSLSTWGELHLAGLATGRTRVFVPIVLATNYRRVAPSGRNAEGLEAFNVTVLGLGAGLGLAHPIGENVRFEARAHPVFGLASSSFVDALGTARLLDADAQVHLGRLFGRVGLSLGYGFRSQFWNVNASNLFPDVTDELFDYKGRHHLFRMGVNW